MIESMKQSFSTGMSLQDKVNKTREMLQVLMLKIMFDRGAFKNMAFVGGTALRVLYDLRRYSEDIDFSLINKSGYSFTGLLKGLVFELKHYGFVIEAEPKQDKIVHSSMIKFPELLTKLGLSQMKEQKLAVKLEIDINPPKGWKTIVTPITRSFVFAVNSFNLPSMYATKLHACFFRRFTKGRDFYDLIWYLGKNIEPNYVLLNNAIMQTEKKDLKIGSENFRKFMGERLAKIDFKAARKDVERFLEDKNELKLFDKNMIMNMVGVNKLKTKDN